MSGMCENSWGIDIKTLYNMKTGHGGCTFPAYNLQHFHKSP